MYSAVVFLVGVIVGQECDLPPLRPILAQLWAKVVEAAVRASAEVRHPGMHQ